MNNNLKLIKERKELKKLITNINNTISNIIMIKITTEDEELKEILVRLQKYLNKYNEITQYYYNELADKININEIEIKDINDLIRYGII